MDIRLHLGILLLGLLQISDRLREARAVLLRGDDSVLDLVELPGRLLHERLQRLDIRGGRGDLLMRRLSLGSGRLGGLGGGRLNRLGLRSRLLVRLDVALDRLLLRGAVLTVPIAAVAARPLAGVCGRNDAQQHQGDDGKTAHLSDGCMGLFHNITIIGHRIGGCQPNSANRFSRLRRLRRLKARQIRRIGGSLGRHWAYNQRTVACRSRSPLPPELRRLSTSIAGRRILPLGQICLDPISFIPTTRCLCAGC